MAERNFRLGDMVTLNEPWQMLGFGKLPIYHDGFMIVFKRTRAGMYQCLVPGRAETVSIAKYRLDLYSQKKEIKNTPFD